MPICSPRIIICGSLREHSANFRFNDLTFGCANSMLSIRKRAKQILSLSAVDVVWSTLLLSAVVQWCSFRRFHTSYTSDNTMFQCLSKTSTKPVTKPTIFDSSRKCTWKWVKWELAVSLSHIYRFGTYFDPRLVLLVLQQHPERSMFQSFHVQECISLVACLFAFALHHACQMKKMSIINFDSPSPDTIETGQYLDVAKIAELLAPAHPSTTCWTS